MFSASERVFVTGGTGFIGRRLLRFLAQEGVHACASVRTGNQGLSQSAFLEVRQADLFDPESLVRAMAGCRYGIHLAAKVSFDPRDSAELKRVNGEGTESFLEAARRSGLERLVVVSSAATIGISTSPSTLLNESTPFDNRLLNHNVYLASKKEMEHLALARSTSQMAVMVANPTTVFGPGDRSLNSGSIVKAIATGRIVPVPSGGTSVINVDDVAEGLMSILTKGMAGQRYILTRENLTFRKAFETIASVVGRRPRFVYLPPMARLPMKLAASMVHTALVIAKRPAWLITPQIIEDTFRFKYYDSGRAEAGLGWRARVPFADSVSQAWRYYVKEGLIL